MHRGTWLVLASAVAGLIGCRGSLTAPDAPIADAGVPPTHDRGWPPVQDASVPDGFAFDGPGMNPCPDQIPEPVDGTACQFLIADAAACTGPGIRVHVLIEGEEVPRLPDDGWTFIDATETSIELQGAACERASRSPPGVTISFTSYLP
jgi:hypothetical protein